MTEGTAASRKRKLLRGPRRKDEQKDALHADRPALHVELCQILPLDEENALLRVAGRWSVPVPPDVQVLVGRDALVAPLPPGAGIDGAGLWSAGFEVPAEAAETDLAMVSPVGATPLPRPRVAGEKADPQAELDAAHLLVEQLSRRCELNERQLVDFRGKLVEAWNEVAQMREHLNGRAAEYETATRRASQVDAIVSELEARADRAEDELAARRRELEAECESLRGELAGRERAAAEASELLERFEAARTRAEDLTSQLTKARAVAHDAMDVATNAARELLAERAKVEEAGELADRHAERLACVERELQESHDALAAAEGRAATLEAELADAREQLEKAAEVADQLTDAKAVLEAAHTEATELRERIEVAERTSGEGTAELAKAHAELEKAAEVAKQLTEANAALEAAHTEATELRERIEVAERTSGDDDAELAGAREELADAETRIAELEGDLAAAREELAEATTRIAELEGELTSARKQAEAAEQTEGDGTAELDDLRQRFGTAVARGDALETQLTAAREELAKTAVDRPARGVLGRSKVSARVHGEVVEKLEQVEAERERAETEVAQLGDRVRELESEMASYHEDAHVGVEEDLRHLLAARQRELDETRAELKEQRARYAAVASKMSPAELAETAETRPAEDDWTALDDELLNRLTRAKQLSQPD